MVLEEFKQYCINERTDIFVQKYIIESETFFFSKIRNGGEFEFKRDIAGLLGVHVRDVVIVGSAKLGFSLKPEVGSPGLYLFKEFDYAFKKSELNSKSDLDIAIVSSRVFDIEFKNLYNYTNFYSKDGSWGDMKSLAHFAIRGRLATRFLPAGFNLTDGIKQTQAKYQMEYGRVVNIEIYKSWHYFETYHQENIKNIKVNLIS